MRKQNGSKDIYQRTWKLNIIEQRDARQYQVMILTGMKRILW